MARLMDRKVFVLFSTSAGYTYLHVCVFVRYTANREICLPRHPQFAGLINIYGELETAIYS